MQHPLYPRKLALAIVVLTGIASALLARPLPRQIPVPKSDKPIMSTDADNDLLAKFPAYTAMSKRQIVKRGDWDGKSDYAARVRSCWTVEGLYFRFDIHDDQFRPTTNTSLQNLTGDYILLEMTYDSVGPEAKPGTFKVLLLPDPEKSICAVVTESDKINKLKIGRPRTKLFKTGPKDYSIILQIPTIEWVAKPRKTRQMRAQIFYGDSDTKGKIDHVFAQFPRNESSWSFSSSVGILHFADKMWAKILPAKAKFNGTEATVLLDYGNLDNQSADITISVRDSKGDVAKAFTDIVKLEPGVTKQGRKIKLDLSDLKKGEKMRVEVKVGIAHDPATFHVQRDDSADGAIFCPDLIEHRMPSPKRPLAVYRNKELMKETFRHMAGGGEVIWSIGQYDASSAEFPEKIRKNGPQKITIPSKGDITQDIPWAIFGGADHLDKMGEPLVIKLDSEALKGTSPLQPDFPRYKYLQLNSRNRRLARSARQLLLLGVVARHMNLDQYAVVRVTDQNGKTLLSQRLRPSAFSGGKGHSYVLRVWLTGTERELRVDNPSSDGPRFEIDFMALLAGGKAVTYKENRPGLHFTGTPEAEQFSKMLPINLFFMENFLLDNSGNAYSSMPGGRYRDFSINDYAAVMNELPNWGVVEPMKKMLKDVAFIGQRITPAESGRNPSGNALLLSGIRNIWRHTGRDQRELGKVWQMIVERRVEDLEESALGTQLGLPPCNGEMGTPRREGGSSIPMVFASRSGLKSAAYMAERLGYRTQASQWKDLEAKISKSFRKNLIAPPGGQKLHSAAVYPAAHGFGEVKGIQATFPEKSWIYARNANGIPIAYNGDIRVFDTPYLFAGIPFWFDTYGFSITEDQQNHMNRTRVFLLDQPLFKDKLYRKHGMITYKSSATQTWMAMAALALDNQILYTSLINAFIRHNFDEYTKLPENADIEVSPFTFEEKLNVDAKTGVNLGGSLDEASAMTTMNALKMARVVAGIDDTQDSVLRIMPRLPSDWKTISAKNWMICHDLEDGFDTKIDYSYERFTGNRFALKFQSEKLIRKVQVRLGPFPGGIRRVSLNVNGKISTATPVRIGGAKWVLLDQLRTKSLDIVVRPIGF